MKIIELPRDDLDRVWSIDRTEVIERLYVLREGELVLEAERHDVSGWPEGEPEEYGPILDDCLARGGTFLGVVDEDADESLRSVALIGVAILESRFIGAERDQLQLKFLHVSQRARGQGIGIALWDRVVACASALGAQRLYISATPSENTVGFYLRRGCRLARELDPELFALEPKDIHLEYEIDI